MPNNFERDLELFRREVQAGTQFFYAFLAIDAVLAPHPEALRIVNRTPLFWRTARGALHTAFFISLGRIFDQGSPFNIDMFLRSAQSQRAIFSKASLGDRKRAAAKNADEWLQEFLNAAYELAIEDFRRARRFVGKYRAKYRARYADIRNKVLAHNEMTDANAVHALYSKTRILELEKMFNFLNQFQEVFWQLYHNGKRPVWRKAEAAH